MSHLVAEVLLQSVDTVPCDQRHELVRVVKVSTILYVAIAYQFDSKLSITVPGLFHTLFVEFDGLYLSYPNALSVRDNQRCSAFEKAFFNLHTDNDRTFRVEARAFDHLYIISFISLYYLHLKRQGTQLSLLCLPFFRTSTAQCTP